jgi:regulation of enolase protein 1 (concanavalin A-like superfamily)
MVNLLAGCSRRTLANGLRWLNEPEEWSFDEHGGLSITPNAATDFFRPLSDIAAPANDNCCLLYKTLTGDFTATTFARADLKDFGDAAALTMRVSPSQWAKVCLERSPIGDIALVSVVTNPFSDDANSELLSSPECWLRLSRKGASFGMHFSLDGRPGSWRLVRAFGMELPPDTPVMVGIHAQAPITGGCSAWFQSFELTDVPVSDFRSGL